MLHRQILSLGQDMVYGISKGKCKTPKQVGIGVAMHQITQSKEVVQLQNKYGHGISYDDVLRIDTSWAELQANADGAFIPANMVQGRITRGAGDNFNRATNSLGGAHHDVVNMVLYQEAEVPTLRPLQQAVPTKQVRAKTIDSKRAVEGKIQQCPNLGGKQPGPMRLYGKIKLEWFVQCSPQHKTMRAIDKAMHLLRMMPIKMFEDDIQKKEVPTVPGWTVFHSRICKEQNPKKTEIGYCPMLPASATEMNTIYTMMKTFQQACAALDQEWTYITYDEAIYSKAQMIKWRNMAEFENDHLEMGGMHRAMNFMGDIGHIMQESGFEDIVVESNVYGSAVTHNILHGKSYNRGVRLHKLMYECLQRLKWTAMGEWIAGEGREHLHLSDEDHKAIVSKAKKCLKLFDVTKEPACADELCDAVAQFTQASEPLQRLMELFEQHGRKCSNTFVFWDNYITDWVQLLLDYIAAKRSDDRERELEAFAEMIPLDFACGHQNYARWSIIAVSEGQLLKDNHPEIHDALSNGHGSVHHTSKPFCAVWHDMGIEQSINKDCGKHRHICTKDDALNKYYLTAHYKACVTSSVKAMCGMYEDSPSQHKEATISRQKDDNKAVEAMVKVITERMVNPFEIEQGSSADNMQPLINIATSTVATEEITDSLCNIRKKGETEMKKFINSRLLCQEKDFFDPVQKPKISTFTTLNKPLVSKQKQTAQSINIDRQIFSRLAVIGQNRETDISNLLKYELAPVPLTLFHLDGSLKKTAKNAALTWLHDEHLSIQELPPFQGKTFLIIDFMMLLRMVCTETNDCQTFGQLSDNLLNIVLSHNMTYIAVVGDDYTKSHSIKGAERSRRGAVEMQEIRNPQRTTTLPRQRKKMFTNIKTKANIANFLMEDWLQQGQERLQGGQQLYLSGGFKDPKRAKVVIRGYEKDVRDLESDQEEADSRIFLNLAYGKEHLDSDRVIIWSIDTDVAALCPRYCLRLGYSEMYFKTGVKQHKRYIPVHEVISDLGNDIVLILPILHALTGCDSTSAFSHLGKPRWLKMIKDHPEILDKVKLIGQHPSIIPEDAVEACTKLVCLMYNSKKTDLNAVRYELFSKKKLSSDKLPPTMDAFTHHLKRVNYQSFIWLHAHEQFLNLPQPQNNGWKIEKGELLPVYMSNPPAPDVVLTFTECKCKGNCSTRRCKCRHGDLMCTDACQCDEELCINRSTSDDESSDEDNE